MQSDDTVYVIMSQNPSTVFTISQIYHHRHCIHRILPQLLQLHRFFTVISYINSSQNYYNFTGSLHTLIIYIQLLQLHRFFHNHYNFADVFHIVVICCMNPSQVVITCPQIYQYWKLGVNFGYFLLILSRMIDLAAKTRSSNLLLS